MIYREFQGSKLSLLGFGCMRLPLLEGGTIDQNTLDAMVDAAIRKGVNYFDTAYPYHNGQSEPFVGPTTGATAKLPLANLSAAIPGKAGSWRTSTPATRRRLPTILPPFLRPS